MGSGDDQSRPSTPRTGSATPAGTAGNRAVGGPDTLTRNGKKGKKQRTLGAKVRRVLFYLLLLCLAGVLVVSGGFAYLYQTTEIPKANAEFETNTSHVYFEDGKTELG